MKYLTAHFQKIIILLFFIGSPTYTSCCLSISQRGDNREEAASPYQRIGQGVGFDVFQIGSDVLLDSMDRKQSLWMLSVLISEEHINETDLELFFRWYSRTKEKCKSINITVYSNLDQIKTAKYANQGFELEGSPAPTVKDIHLFAAIYSRQVQKCNEAEAVYEATESYMYAPNLNELSNKKMVFLNKQ